MPFSRRKFLSSAAGFGGAAAAQSLLPVWALNQGALNQAVQSLSAQNLGAQGGEALKALTGDVFDLHIEETQLQVAGRKARAITVNGQLPAPLLRWREGDDLTLRVTNHLKDDTSIHWHGILLPFQMDGVPGVSFPGIKPGDTFVYKFPVKQAGTYWYHSHSGFQEQLGHYGPIIIDPAGADPVGYDREYVIVLSDWAFEQPERIFAKLKKSSEAYNFQKRTLVDFIDDAAEEGFGAAFSERAMWGDMRMSPADIADVTGSLYTYLANGHAPDDNWTGLFNAGERVRLRFINASAMTIFNVRIPGLPMTVVQADGLNVEPLETDEFQIGVAETFDVVVTPGAEPAYTVMCESMDRSGYARATLASRPGLEAPVPPLRERPTLTMKDMGMAHHGGAHAMSESDKPMAQMDHGEHAMHNAHANHEAPPDQHSMHDMNGRDKADGANGMGGMSSAQTHDHPRGPGVVNVAEAPTNRLGEPGIGLENQPHRVLVYTDLRSLDPNPDTRAPEREMELHLTSNMERYMWSFDGRKFSEVKEPIAFRKGERLRLTLVNDTMMAHPIHLHGMFFDVVTGEHGRKPRKHTITVKPGEKLSVDITADAPGDWAFHCHLLYHMVAGMMRVVSIRDDDAAPERAHDNNGDHDAHHGMSHE